MGEVAPTKVTIVTRNIILAAVDTSPFSTEVLLKAASLARHIDGDVIVLHIINIAEKDAVEQLRDRTQKLLADIRHQFITITGSVPEEIMRVAEQYQVTDIVMGKRGYKPWEKVLVGSVSQAVIESSSIPVILVENRKI